MLGLIGRHENAHLRNVNYCMPHPKTNEVINLQPWCVEGGKPATKNGPAIKTVVRPASQEDFKAILEIQGNTKDPLVGELPEHIAKVKKPMYEKAMAEYNKLTGQTASAKVETGA